MPDGVKILLGLLAVAAVFDVIIVLMLLKRGPR